jgi:hypothetical protein
MKLELILLMEAHFIGFSGAEAIGALNACIEWFPFVQRGLLDGWRNVVCVLILAARRRDRQSDRSALSYTSYFNFPASVLPILLRMLIRE